MPAAARSSGPEVRVAPGDRRRGVDDRAGAGLDERLGRDPVEVAWSITAISPGCEPLHEVLGAAVDAGDARDEPRRRRRRAVASERHHQRPRSRAAAASSSSAWSRAVVALGRARQHARQLDDPVVASSGCGPGTVVTSPSSLFATATWASAKAATCGRWVTTSTWWSARQRGQRPADRERGLARRCRRRPRRTPASGGAGGERRGAGPAWPGPARRPTRPWPAAAAAMPGLAASRNVTSSPGSSSPTSTSTRACGMASSRRWACDRRGQRGAAARRAAADRGGGRDASAAGRRAGRSSAAAARSWRSSSASRAARLVPVGEHVGQGVAVLAAQVAQQLAALAQRVQALGVVVDRLARSLGRSAATSASSAARRRSRSLGAANGAPGRRARRWPRPSASSGAAVVGRARSRRACRGLPVGDGVGQQVLLGVERSSSSGSSMPAAVELVDLEAQQVDLAGPGAARRRRAAERGVDRGQPCRGPPCSGPRSTPPKRSRAVALHRAARSSDWWACWPCRSTRRGARSASAAAGGQAAVDVGAATARRGDDPGQDDLVVVRRRTGPRPRASSAPGPHQHRVGPAADQQLDRLDHHGLAGAGLAGERGHARARARGAGRR